MYIVSLSVLLELFKTPEHQI